MDVDRYGEALVFRAGKGDWYNQPHDQRWDLGEDVQPLPPAPWHAAREAALEEAQPAPRIVVVDATQMSWLPGQDWGFLARLALRLRELGAELVVVAERRILQGVRALGLEELLRTSTSIDEALCLDRDDQALFRRPHAHVRRRRVLRPDGGPMPPAPPGRATRRRSALRGYGRGACPRRPWRLAKIAGGGRCERGGGTVGGGGLPTALAWPPHPDTARERCVVTPRRPRSTGHPAERTASPH